MKLKSQVYIFTVFSLCSCVSPQSNFRTPASFSSPLVDESANPQELEAEVYSVLANEEIRKNPLGGAIKKAVAEYVDLVEAREGNVSEKQRGEMLKRVQDLVDVGDELSKSAREGSQWFDKPGLGNTLLAWAKDKMPNHQNKVESIVRWMANTTANVTGYDSYVKRSAKEELELMGRQADSLGGGDVFYRVKSSYQKYPKVVGTLSPLLNPETKVALADNLQNMSEHSTTMWTGFRLESQLRGAVAKLTAGQELTRGEINSLQVDVTEIKKEIFANRQEFASIRTSLFRVKADVTQVKADLGEVKEDLKGVKSDVTQIKAAMDKQADKERVQQDYERKVGQANAALKVYSALGALIKDPTSREVFGKSVLVAQAGVKIYSSVISPGISKMIMTGSIAGAAAELFSGFAGFGADPNAAVIAEIKALRKEVQDLRDEMKLSFMEVNDRLDKIYGRIDEGFGQIEKKQDQTNRLIEQLRADVRVLGYSVVSNDAQLKSAIRDISDQISRKGKVSGRAADLYGRKFDTPATLVPLQNELIEFEEDVFETSRNSAHSGVEVNDVRSLYARTDTAALRVKYPYRAVGKSSDSWKVTDGERLLFQALDVRKSINQLRIIGDLLLPQPFFNVVRNGEHDQNPPATVIADPDYWLATTDKTLALIRKANYLPPSDYFNKFQWTGQQIQKAIIAFRSPTFLDTIGRHSFQISTDLLVYTRALQWQFLACNGRNRLSDSDCLKFGKDILSAVEQAKRDTLSAIEQTERAANASSSSQDYSKRILARARDLLSNEKPGLLEYDEAFWRGAPTTSQYKVQWPEVARAAPGRDKLIELPGLQLPQEFIAGWPQIYLQLKAAKEALSLEYDYESIGADVYGRRVDGWLINNVVMGKIFGNEIRGGVESSLRTRIYERTTNKDLFICHADSGKLHIANWRGKMRAGKGQFGLIKPKPSEGEVVEVIPMQTAFANINNGLWREKGFVQKSIRCEVNASPKIQSALKEEIAAEWSKLQKALRAQILTAMNPNESASTEYADIEKKIKESAGKLDALKTYFEHIALLALNSSSAEKSDQSLPYFFGRWSLMSSKNFSEAWEDSAEKNPYGRINAKSYIRANQYLRFVTKFAYGLPSSETLPDVDIMMTRLNEMKAKAAKTNKTKSR